MAGDDEARARVILVEMQGRISQGPSSALGVASEASPEQVRSAFLTLTKQFHPARFGRMSSDVQRLSNEVFLGIKSAHEMMMRALGVPTRSGLGSGPRTGMIPVVTAEGSARTPTGPTPVPRGTQPGARTTATQPPLARPQGPTPSRTLTPARSGSPTSPATPPGGPNKTPPFGLRLGTPPTPRPGTPPNTRPGTPPIRTATRPPPMPPKPPLLDEDTIRGVGPMPQIAPEFDERVERQQVLDLLAAKSWAAARQTVLALAARVPQSKEYRALLCYARGREAQAAGRFEDATLEFQRALQLDPAQVHAKSALAEPRRR